VDDAIFTVVEIPVMAAGTINRGVPLDQLNIPSDPYPDKIEFCQPLGATSR
jgi:hypothetical protein